MTEITTPASRQRCLPVMILVRHIEIRVHVHLNGVARIRVQSAAFDDHWWRGRVEGMELQDQPDAIAVFTQSRDSWLVSNETKWSV